MHINDFVKNQGRAAALPCPKGSSARPCLLVNITRVLQKTTHKIMSAQWRLGYIFMYPLPPCYLNRPTIYHHKNEILVVQLLHMGSRLVFDIICSVTSSSAMAQTRLVIKELRRVSSIALQILYQYTSNWCANSCSLRALEREDETINNGREAGPRPSKL